MRGGEMEKRQQERREEARDETRERKVKRIGEKRIYQWNRSREGRQSKGGRGIYHL